MEEKAGLRIIDVSLNGINGGSFAVTLSKIGSRYANAGVTVNQFLAQEKEEGFDTLDHYIDFAKRVAFHRVELKQLVQKLNAAGKKIIGYGASTKGNVLLQY